MLKPLALMLDQAAAQADPAGDLLLSLPPWLDAARRPLLAQLPSVATQQQRYTRWRLLASAAGNWQALLLYWPPGASTPIHDHAGGWGVEALVQGCLSVQDYHIDNQHPSLRLNQGPAHRLCFESRTTVLAVADHAHRCWNPDPSIAAITLHIYGRMRSRCRVYEERASTWQQSECRPEADGDWPTAALRDPKAA